MSAGASSGQKRVLDLLDLDLEVVLSLGTELRSFSRTVHLLTTEPSLHPLPLLISMDLFVLNPF